MHVSPFTRMQNETTIAMVGNCLHTETDVFIDDLTEVLQYKKHVVDFNFLEPLPRVSRLKG